MLRRTYSIYNTKEGIDERSKYLKKRVIFKKEPIIKEYYKVNRELNKTLSEYISMYMNLDYSRFKILKEYNRNILNIIFEYICYLMIDNKCEDKIDILNIFNIYPDDKESQLYVDNALDEIKIACIMMNVNN